MPLQPGTKIGPYEIVEALGANGAYKATDTAERRTVAIKVFPPHFSENPELKQRFERDAQTLAALKHPGICTLYDVRREDDTDYVVMEHLEGETLAERLGRGALPLDEALKVAIAMADVLDKAHRQGVMHRSLNPSNVMLTRTGTRLLDFGFAKLTGSPSESSVSASMLPTATGAIPGAVAGASEYTAPEQLEGKEADARTDIFAFGTILYEMVTGKKAFEGKTPMLLTAAILSASPDPPSKAQPMVPPALDYIVQRCLAKDPRQRVQTACDLMGQLQWIEESGSQIGIPAPVAARRRKRERLVWASAAIAVLLAMGMAAPAYRYFGDTVEPREARFQVNMSAPGRDIAVSPDGRWIVTTVPDGLDARRFDSAATQPLLRGESGNTRLPFWSPDNRSVAFFADGRLRKVDISGGPAQNICDAAGPWGGGSWNAEGEILFANGGVLYRVLAAGGQPEAVTSLDSSQQETEHTAPYFLPDGRHYLYLSVSAQPSNNAIYAGSLDSKERTRILAADSRAVHTPPGYLLFNREHTVFAQPFNADKLALTGDAIRIADVPYQTVNRLISPGLARTAILAVSQTGVLAYRIGGSANVSQPNLQAAAAALAAARGRGNQNNQNNQNNRGGIPSPAGNQLIGYGISQGSVADRALVWFDRSGAPKGIVGTPGGYVGVDLSPDGKKLAVHRHEADGGDAWVLDAAATGTIQPQRLTFDASQDNSSPVWSPDGKQIAFGSKRKAKWGLYVKPADNSRDEELLFESDAPNVPVSWSPDSKFLVYSTADPKTGKDVWILPLTGKKEERKPFSFLQSERDESVSQISPDGKWIAYASDQTGRREVYIRPFPNGPGVWQVTTNGGFGPRWRRDGKELYFIAQPNPIQLLAVEIRVSGSSIEFGVPRVLFPIGNPLNTHATSYSTYAVSGDGQRFLIPQPPGSPGARGATAISGTGSNARPSNIADAIATIVDRDGGPAAGFTAGPNAITIILNWPAMLKRK